MLTVCLDEDTLGFTKAFADSASLVQPHRHLSEYPADDHDLIAHWLSDEPNVCVIDFDRDHARAVLAAETVHAHAPETAIFAVSSRPEPNCIIEAMRSGCSEYLVKPVDRDQLLSALARVGGRKKDRKEAYKAQILAFMGAKGGCGVTSLVTQMGALLAKTFARKTLVIDLHSDFGDAALYLGVTKYRYHFFELLESVDRLDAELLQSFVIQHPSGLDLIPAPEAPEPARDFLPGTLEQTFDFLRFRYEFILVDMPPVLSDAHLEVIRGCDYLQLVTVPEVSAIRNIVRWTDYCKRHEISKDKLRVVLNRHQKRGAISEEQIERAVGQPIFWKVPNQYAHNVKTISSGDPVAELSSSEVTRNIRDWAAAIGTKPSADKKKEARGLLGLFNR